MKAFRIALCAHAFAGVTQARPIIVEESSSITPPDSSWEFFGRFGVAIDGDWALISGERFVPDENSELKCTWFVFIVSAVNQILSVSVIVRPR